MDFYCVTGVYKESRNRRFNRNTDSSRIEKRIGGKNIFSDRASIVLIGLLNAFIEAENHERNGSL